MTKEEYLAKDRPFANALMARLFDASIVAFDRLGGMTNRSYRTTLSSGKIVVVRIPGEGTESIINREFERRSTELGCACGADTTLHYFGPEGVKVMDYIDGAVTMTAEQLREPSNICACAEIFKKLHSTGVDTKVPFEVFDMARQYRGFIDNNHVELYPDFEGVTAQVVALKRSVDAECDVRIVPCHCDSLVENWVKDSTGRMYLIDWEYAGMNDAMWDLADVSIEAVFSANDDDLLLAAYFGRPATENEYKNFMANKIYLDYLWTLWGKTRVPFDGQFMEDYALNRYIRLKKNIKEVM